MSFTLSDLLQGAYQRLGQANVSTATGGSTTTVVDTKQTGQHSDDDWNRGALIVTYDAGGAGAAPEGEFSVISDYVDSSGTFTVDTLTAAVASGDRYMFCSELYPLHTMIELTNTTLQALGDMDLVDTTTLDTAASQTEYAASVEWKRRGPLRVDIQTRTNDANDNQWNTVSNWEYIPAVGGSTGLIVLPQLPASRDIRVWYRDQHPYVVDYDDVINETVPPELLTLMLVEKALEWQITRQQGGDDFLIQRLNDAKQQVAEADQDFLRWRPKKRPKLLVMRRWLEDDDFRINP